MLRRVARALRLLFWVLGIALFVWLPASYFFVMVAALPRIGVSASQGGFAIQVVQGQPPAYFFNDPELSISRVPGGEGQGLGIVAPQWVQLEGPGFALVIVQLPLWLLAAVCLAWPVTSFLVRRRRR